MRLRAMLARIVLAVFAAGLAATASAQPDLNKVIRAVFPTAETGFELMRS